MSSFTKYSWIVNLKTGDFLANARESVRVMGVLVGVGDITIEERALIPSLMMLNHRHNNGDDDHHADTKDYELAFSMRTMTIDDGTDSISFWIPQRMIDSLDPTMMEPGQTFDCLLKLRQSASIKRWFAETLIPIQNPKDEQFRWMELSHQDKHHQSLGNDNLNSASHSYCLSHSYGFPARKSNAMEVYRLVSLHVETQQQQQQKENRARQYKNHQNQQQCRASGGKLPPSKQQQPPQLEGILLGDLATVLQKPQSDIQEMIHFLQLEGRIYQNERGEYLPL